MKTETYKNRYNDEFTFTELENGNIQWSGNFQYCRFSWPNDYLPAYKAYTSVGGLMGIEEFKEDIHRYDDNHNPSDTALVYGKLLKSKKHIIDMVDPSGGPYLKSGMKQFGQVIKEFKPNKNGYEIVTE